MVTGSRSVGEGLKGLLGRHPVVPVEVDLGAAGGPEELVGRAVEEFGGVDVLVNNMGLSGRAWRASNPSPTRTGAAPSSST